MSGQNLFGLPTTTTIRSRCLAELVELCGPFMPRIPRGGAGFNALHKHIKVDPARTSRQYRRGAVRCV